MKNAKLKQEQESVISSLLKTNRELDKALQEKTVLTKDDVTEQMKSNWDKKKNQERTLTGM
jgi:hypothetical protein